MQQLELELEATLAPADVDVDVDTDRRRAPEQEWTASEARETVTMLTRRCRPAQLTVGTLTLTIPRGSLSGFGRTGKSRRRCLKLSQRCQYTLKSRPAVAWRRCRRYGDLESSLQVWYLVLEVSL